MSEIDDLNVVLRRITFRDPILSLCNPKMEFIKTQTGARLSLTIDTYRMDDGKPWRGFEAIFDIDEYLIGQYTQKPTVLVGFIRQSLVEFLQHEIVESLMLDGDQAIIPEHWGPDLRTIRDEHAHG